MNNHKHGSTMNFIKFNDRIINFDHVSRIEKRENHIKREYSIELYNAIGETMEIIGFPDQMTLLSEHTRLLELVLWDSLT